MPRRLRFLIELHDPYLAVLCDLAAASCRTHKEQATWLIRQHLDQVIRENDHALDTFLEADLTAAEVRHASAS